MSAMTRINTVMLAVGPVLGALASAQTAPPPDGWPVFSYQGVVTDKEELDYNPTGEFIFPSVFYAVAHLADPLGEWYL